jgi:hypothetical protein
MITSRRAAPRGRGERGDGLAKRIEFPGAATLVERRFGFALVVDSMGPVSGLSAGHVNPRPVTGSIIQIC